MNAENAVSVYVVMRSPKYKFEVIEKTENGNETSEYINRIDSNWTVVSTGSEQQCRSYKTKGQLFKERMGYSRTMKNLLAKKGVSIEEYKKLRKERKKAQLLESDAKHDRARAGRKAKAAKK